MNDKWYSVDQAADMLSLHPKTLRRYINEGKLRANKVGKQYRISGHDLSVFVEGRDIIPGREREDDCVCSIDVSAVADIAVRSGGEAERIERTLIAALNSKDSSYGSSSMSIQRQAGTNKLRVMLWGTPVFITVMLECISALAGRNE